MFTADSMLRILLSCWECSKKISASSALDCARTVLSLCMRLLVLFSQPPVTNKLRNPRTEIRDGSTRPVNRDYFYIPLHPVIDAIKYKVSKLTSTIKAQYTPSEDRKEYICLRCGTEWTELDVLSLVSDDGFVCQSCGAILQSTEEVKGEEGIDRTGHEKNSKLMAQLDKMLNLLKQIDSVEIPPNDFDTAWDHKIDVARNQHTHPVRAAVSARPAKQEAVRGGGNAKTDTAALEISLTSTEEKTAAEQAEESARKAELEKQNALPVWHTHSTVSTNAGNVDYIKREPAGGGVQVKPELKEEDEDQKPAIDALDDKVAAYYAEMAKEKALEAEQDASSADEDDSEDFDEEFEDVGAVSASASDGNTPATAASASAKPPTSNPVPESSGGSGIKRELDSDSPSTGVPQTSTASVTPSTPADEGPAQKKVKVENDNEPGAGVKREAEAEAVPAAAPEVKKEESDEDDEEFEDV